VGASAAGAVLACLLLASCTKVEIEDHSLQYNEASGSLGSRVMLLNVVRAAKGYPMQFSRVSNYTGSSRMDGSLSFSLPFILNTFGSPSPTRLQANANPSAQLKTGVQSLQLVDLNTAEVQKNLRQQVGIKDFQYYRSQGWPSTLVNTVLIEELQVEPELVVALDAASKAACFEGGSARSRKTSGLRGVCSWLLRRDVEDCLTSSPDAPQPRASDVGTVVSAFPNDPRRYCKHMAFQWFFASIRVLVGVSFVVDPKIDTDECTTSWAPKEEKGDKASKSKSRPEEKKINESVKDGKVSVDIGVNLKVSDKAEKDKKKDEDEQEPVILLNIPKALSRHVSSPREANALDRLRNRQLCMRKEGRIPLRIAWRSPERMVRYLGEVLAAQEFGPGKRPVQVLNENGDLVELFRVQRGRNSMGRAAVAVDDPEGETFSIPRPDYDSSKGHLSLQALALVMESFNLAVSGKELPQPATLLLPGG
jgi:hypothetical protein